MLSLDALKYLGKPLKPLAINMLSQRQCTGYIPKGILYLLTTRVRPRLKHLL